MVQNLLHGATMWQRALNHLTTALSDFSISSLTFVGVEQQNQLLLNQLSLFGVGRGLGRTSSAGNVGHVGVVGVGC